MDAIIVGSDQVWRPMCNVPQVWLYEMFLDSVYDLEFPKIAYAASFGSEEWEYDDEQTNRCAKLVQAFRAVSMREDSGVRLCNDYLRCNALHVLDPTMLLKGEDYNALIDRPSVFNHPTLFAYLLDSSTEKIAQIKQIAAAKQLDIYLKGANDDIMRDDSIEQWLNWIKSAKYVVTDSFHGAVFSILFHRPFNVYLDSWRGSARFNTLLSITNCQSRGISKGKLPLTSDTIEWEAVEVAISNYRKKSIEFLENSLRAVL